MIFILTLIIFTAAENEGCLRNEDLTMTTLMLQNFQLINQVMSCVSQFLRLCSTKRCRNLQCELLQSKMQMLNLNMVHLTRRFSPKILVSQHIATDFHFLRFFLSYQVAKRCKKLKESISNWELYS